VRTEPEVCEQGATHAQALAQGLPDRQDGFHLPGEPPKRIDFFDGCPEARILLPAPLPERTQLTVPVPLPPTHPPRSPRGCEGRDIRITLGAKGLRGGQLEHLVQ